MPNATPALTPRFISKAEAVQTVGFQKLVEGMLHASQPSSLTSWLRMIQLRPGTQCRDSLINVASVHTACDRLLAGEHQPLFPSERPKPLGFDIEPE